MLKGVARELGRAEMFPCTKSGRDATLNIIYDVNFFDFSHAFRKGHSQHKAVHEIRERCRKLNIGWIVSADIEGLFDNIDHNLLRTYSCIMCSTNGL